MFIALFFLTLLVYFTYRFLFSSAQTKQQVYRFLPAFILFGGLMLLTALFSLSEWLTAISPRNLPALATVAELEQLRPADDKEKRRVILIGKTSLAEDSYYRNIILADGTIGFSRSKDFVEFHNSLTEGVVLYANLTHDNLEARVLFFGTKEQFAVFLDRFAIIPSIVTLLSVLGALITWAVPLMRLKNIHRTAQGATQS